MSGRHILSESMSGRHIFSGVDVSLPSKVRGAEAEEEWQEVDWVSWSSGELTVESFLLIFRPLGGGSVKAKTLGSLLRASPVGEEDGRTLVVTTSDALHRSLRLTFATAQQAGDFAKVAEAAEAAATASAGGGNCSGVTEAHARLEAEIKEQFACQLPLVFTGVELYGPDPGAADSEVLLGRGAAAILDPPEDCKSVGSYELLFFSEDEGAAAPVKRLPIGPRMALSRPSEAQDEEEPAQLLLGAGTPGLPGHSICFDSRATAALFARDFRVRQRLMELSLKTVKHGQAADALRSELGELQRQGCCFRLRRFVCFLFIVLVFAGAARVAVLYARAEGKLNRKECVEELRAEVVAALRLLRAQAVATGSKACEAVLGAVPADDVRRCLAAADGGALSMKRCLEALVGPS